jgi:hypothetical protein
MANQDNERILIAFKHRRYIQYMIALVLIVIAITALLFVNMSNVDTYKPLILPLLILVGVVHVIFWRCPACGSSFGKNMSPKYCQECGVKLQD